MNNHNIENLLQKWAKLPELFLLQEYTNHIANPKDFTYGYVYVIHSAHMIGTKDDGWYHLDESQFRHYLELRNYVSTR